MREEVVEEEEKCQHHLDRACTLGRGRLSKATIQLSPFLPVLLPICLKFGRLRVSKEAKIVFAAELICDAILKQLSFCSRIF
jgi:hypothetical protein